MVREGLTCSIAQRLEGTLPGVLRRRLQPEAAGEAIVAGIERRAARIIAPKRWTVLSVLRGVLNPLLDRRMLTDARVQEPVRDADTRVTPQPARARVSR